jgi:hypothetical protein
VFPHYTAASVEVHSSSFVRAGGFPGIPRNSPEFLAKRAHESHSRKPTSPPLTWWGQICPRTSCAFGIHDKCRRGFLVSHMLVQEIMRAAASVAGVQGVQDPKQVWACENEQHIRDYIARAGNTDVIFTDICNLHHMIAHNSVTDGPHLVAKAHLNATGWVCKSVSMVNPRRGEFNSCIADETGESGKTFGGLVAHLQEHNPLMFFGENVPFLSSAS